MGVPEKYPEFSEEFSFVLFEGEEEYLEKAYAWRTKGKHLAYNHNDFAGAVAHFDWKSGTLADPDWNPAVARIAQRTGAAAVPIFFEGANSIGFQLAGVLHAGLRTASLPRELLNKRGRRIRMRIGRPVPAATLQSFEGAREAIEYLRCRTYLLDTAAMVAGPERWLPLLPAKRQAPVAAARGTDGLAAEIAGLSPQSKLCDNGEFAVYLASEGAFPGVVAEIGRLRELAFRQVGEGTGRAVDLDPGAARQRRHLHGGARRKIGSEIARIDLVHGREIGQVGQEDAGAAVVDRLDDVLRAHLFVAGLVQDQDRGVHQANAFLFGLGRALLAHVAPTGRLCAFARGGLPRRGGGRRCSGRCR